LEKRNARAKAKASEKKANKWKQGEGGRVEIPVLKGRFVTAEDGEGGGGEEWENPYFIVDINPMPVNTNGTPAQNGATTKGMTNGDGASGEVEHKSRKRRRAGEAEAKKALKRLRR